jgi:hypothetical protein
MSFVPKIATFCIAVLADHCDLVEEWSLSGQSRHRLIDRCVGPTRLTPTGRGALQDDDDNYCLIAQSTEPKTPEGVAPGLFAMAQSFPMARALSSQGC